MNIVETIAKLNQGGVAVLPTDTLYGLHASAFNKEAVEKIYQLKKRSFDKPLIVLINSWENLAKLEIAVTPGVQERLSQWWPGALSVVLPCPAESLHYLHCGTKTLAVRWPADERLQTILAATGPLVSTTVNLEGEAPAQSVAEAEKIFGSQVDAYLDGGELRGSSSTLIRVKGEQIEVLRQGDVKVDL